MVVAVVVAIGRAVCGGWGVHVVVRGAARVALGSWRTGQHGGRQCRGDTRRERHSDPCRRGSGDGHGHGHGHDGSRGAARHTCCAVRRRTERRAGCRLPAAPHIERMATTTTTTTTTTTATASSLAGATATVSVRVGASATTTATTTTRADVGDHVFFSSVCVTRMLKRHRGTALLQEGGVCRPGYRAGPCAVVATSEGRGNRHARRGEVLPPSVAAQARATTRG